MIRRLSRPLLASTFIVGGYHALKEPGARPEMASKLLETARPYVKGTPAEAIVDDPELAVRLNGAAMLAGGLLLATGKAPRVGALLLAGSIIPTTIAGHSFWDEKDPQAKQMQMMQFLKNASMLGGVLLAAEDTAGKPGLAYRAGMVADAAGRVAHDVAKDAQITALKAQTKIG